MIIFSSRGFVEHLDVYREFVLNELPTVNILKFSSNTNFLKVEYAINFIK